MRPEAIKAGKGATSQPLIGLLSNRKSSTNQERLDKFRKAIGTRPNVFHYEFDEISDLSNGLRLFADAGVGLLVINGGDGTVQATLSALINEQPFTNIPPLAVLPGGKTNMIADDLKAKGRPERLFNKLCRRVARNKLRKRLVKRALIQLDLGDDSPLRHGMFFAGAGIVKGILWTRETLHKKGLPTRFAHMTALFRLLFGAAMGRPPVVLKSADVTIEVDGIRYAPKPYSIFLMTTLSRLLLGIKPFGNEGGAIGVCLIEAQPGLMRKAIFALLTGRFSEAKIEGITAIRGDRIAIEGQDAVTLDGELYEPVPGRPIRLSATQSFDFIRL